MPANDSVGTDYTAQAQTNGASAKLAGFMQGDKCQIKLLSLRVWAHAVNTPCQRNTQHAG